MDGRYEPFIRLSMNWSLTAAEVIDLAANKVGGISELARQTRWNKGSIAAIKRGDHPLPAWRAAQIAKIIGSDPLLAYVEALKVKALNDSERDLIEEIAKLIKSARET